MADGTQPNLLQAWKLAVSEAKKETPATSSQILTNVFLSPENEIISQWDKHLAVNNLDLLPDNIQPPSQEMFLTATSLNSAFDESVFWDPDKPKYSLIFPGAERMSSKKRKAGHEIRTDKNLKYHDMSFLETKEQSPDESDESAYQSSVHSDEEEADADFMMDVEEAEPQEKLMPMGMLILLFFLLFFS